MNPCKRAIYSIFIWDILLIRYTTSILSGLDTSNLFGSADVKDGVINIEGLQTLIYGNNYFWVTYDISENAIEGEFIDATCESVTVDGKVEQIGSSAGLGERLILLEHNTLFSGGDFGSDNYRIPAVCTALDGTIITAADKRIESGDLPGNIDITIRRSTDNGKTWSEPVIAADFGNNGASDPALVVDRNTGDIILMFASHNGLFASTPSNKIRFNVSRSTDNGLTWSTPQNLSDQIYDSNWNAAWVASGSAHQMRSGRIIAVVGVRPVTSNTLENHMIFSDDGGISWGYTNGAPNAAGGGNESKIVELDNGDLLMNLRSTGGFRKTAVSKDLGLTWSSSLPETELIDPGVNADLIRYTSTLNGFDKSRLLFSNPKSSSGRKNLHVYLSNDEGDTWPELTSKKIYEGNSAYSSLTILNDGTIGLFYENGEFEAYQLSFARFSLDWLSSGTDSYVPK